MSEPALIETDSRSRAVLPGLPNRRFVMRVNDDGSILLQPARIVTDAQQDYDSIRNCAISSPEQLPPRPSAGRANAAR